MIVFSRKFHEVGSLVFGNRSYLKEIDLMDGLFMQHSIGVSVFGTRQHTLLPPHHHHHVKNMTMCTFKFLKMICWILTLKT